MTAETFRFAIKYCVVNLIFMFSPDYFGEWHYQFITNTTGLLLAVAKTTL